MKSSAASRQEITTLESLIRDGYAPLQSGVNICKQSIENIAANFEDKKGLKKQVISISENNDKLEMENQRLREYQLEVKRLRNLLNYKNEHSEFEMEAAQIIARSPNNWYQAVTIDKGEDAGIEKGMAVINPHGLVGRVESVSKRSARVWLITDREMAVGVILQETRDTRGIIEGVGDKQVLRMINIPLYSTVRKGDKVITSGLSEYYPKGIEIGTVEDIVKDNVKDNAEEAVQESGLLLSASVRPSVDFDKLEEVLIIKKVNFLEQEENEGE